MGTHETIITQELSEAAQETLWERNHKTRQLRSPTYLAGLVRCGLCGAAMHVTYPGTEPKSRFKYYVCNNRYNHKSCSQDYIRADILEASVIREIGKLAERKDVIAALVEEYVEHNRKALPELEQKREAIRQEIASLGPEKQKLSRWLRGTELTPQGGPLRKQPEPTNSASRKPGCRSSSGPWRVRSTSCRRKATTRGPSPAS